MIRALFAGVLLPLGIFCSATPAKAQGAGDLEAGVRAYTERGDPREAIRQIGTALDAGNVPTPLRPRAHVFMAHSFLALGDTASAIPHIETAVLAEPCLVPTPELTPPAWQALYERYRPRGASCNPQLVSATLKSALVPGWGQRSLGRTGASSYFFGSTLAAAGGAYLFNTSANRHYDSYQASTDYLEVERLYDRAEESRRRALFLGGTAAVIYLWNVVDALRSASSHDAALSEVRPLTMIPVISPTAGGASIAVYIRMK